MGIRLGLGYIFQSFIIVFGIKLYFEVFSEVDLRLTFSMGSVSSLSLPASCWDKFLCFVFPQQFTVR